MLHSLNDRQCDTADDLIIMLSRLSLMRCQVAAELEFSLSKLGERPIPDCPDKLTDLILSGLGKRWPIWAQRQEVGEFFPVAFPGIMRENRRQESIEHSLSCRRGPDMKTSESVRRRFR